MSDKELLENNEEIENTVEVLSDAEAQRKRTIQIALAGLAVLAVLIGGFLYYRYTKQNTEKEAALKLSRIRPFYDAGQLEVALGGVSGTIRGESVVGLTAISSQYSTAESGRLAALYAGNALATLGRYSEAERYFDQASAAGSDITKMGALAGLASCRANGNQNAAAAKLYEDAAAIGAKLGDEDRYKLFAALHYEKAGQKDKALALYRAIALSPEFSEAINEAKAGIIRLGATLE
jgi:tetratricopeptide (TPR) repeat protein